MDDPFSAERAAASDRMRVRDEYVRWPEMARAGFSRGAGTQPRGFRRVLFLGMGGSAAGGDIVASWLSPRSEFELVTIKGQAPAGDLKGTLAVACSASGRRWRQSKCYRRRLGREPRPWQCRRGGG